MKHKDLVPELLLDQQPIIKVIARRPNQQQAKLSARSKKKQRFSSEDFMGFYSPTHKQYDSLQKGRLDIYKVFPRTPSKQGHENKDMKEQTSCLMRTPPTKSQLRVRLKLNEISNDFQNFKSKKYQDAYIDKVEKNTENPQKSTRQGIHIHLPSKQNHDAGLIEENRRLKEENLRMQEVIARMKQNLEDCRSKIAQWQKGDIGKELHIRNLQEENGEFKTENEALYKNSAAKDQLNFVLQQNIQSLKGKLEKDAKERDIQKQQLEQSHSKIIYLQELTKSYVRELQREREKCKYLEIELQVLKQKKFEIEASKNLHEEKIRLMEDNKRWRMEASRLKSRLTNRDELFQLSPERN